MTAQIPVTTKPTGSTPSDRPGTTYGVDEPAWAAASFSAGLPRIVLGSVVTEVCVEKAPTTKEACMGDSEALNVTPDGFLAAIKIEGISNG
jgi:hypothetical protein